MESVATRAGAGTHADCARAYLLTFDVGRIAVLAEASPRGLAVEVVASPQDAPGGLEPASEKEPWWRLLGAPLTQVRALPAIAVEGSQSSEAEMIELYLGHADQAARRLSMHPEDGYVCVALERDRA